MLTARSSIVVMPSGRNIGMPFKSATCSWERYAASARPSGDRGEHGEDRRIAPAATERALEADEVDEPRGNERAERERQRHDAFHRAEDAATDPAGHEALDRLDPATSRIAFATPIAARRTNANHGIEEAQQRDRDAPRRERQRDRQRQAALRR